MCLSVTTLVLLKFSKLFGFGYEKIPLSIGEDFEKFFAGSLLQFGLRPC